MTNTRFRRDVVVTINCRDPSQLDRVMETMARVAAGLSLEGVESTVGVYVPHLHHHDLDDDDEP